MRRHAAGNRPPDPLAVAGKSAKVAKDQASAANSSAKAILDLATAAQTRAHEGSVSPADQTAFGQAVTPINQPSPLTPGAPPPPIGDPTQ